MTRWKRTSNSRTRIRALACLLAASAIGACDCGTQQIRSVVPEILVQPAKLNFGTVPVGSAVEQPLEIRNVGQGPLDLASVIVANTSDLTVPVSEMMVTDCNANPRHVTNPMSLQSGECARVSVRWMPAKVETLSNQVIITSNDPKHPKVSVPVTGSGADVPCLKVTPPSTLDFGNVPAGMKKQLSIVVENCGHIAYQLTELSLSPANSRVFSVGSMSGGLPSLPFMFAPGANGTIPIVYEPSAPTSSAGDTAQFAVATDSRALATTIVKIVGHSSGPECGGSNAPVAKIALLSNNQAIATSVVPFTQVTLDGSRSTAPSGATIRSYAWRLVSAPPNSTATINGTGAKASILCSIAGDFVVGLTVTDSNGCESTETTATIHVVPGSGIHVQLTWPESYGDLDLHYIGPGGHFFDQPRPLGQGGDLYFPYAAHSFDGTMMLPTSPFGMQAPIDWGKNNTIQPDGTHYDDPTLDVDQQWGKGPENVTQFHPFQADYEVNVHYYCSSTYDENPNGGLGGGSYPPLGPATAVVTVWFNGQQIWTGQKVLTSHQVWDAATIHVTNSGNTATVTPKTAVGGDNGNGCADGN